MDKVVLGLSGGVDSAVAAHLLRESGLAVYGLYLDNGLPGADAAREAAASLSVPLTITDSREAMEQYVCTPFAEAYLRGETPNPCILCNPAVKFRALLDEAERIGAKYIATGHYARAENGAIYRGQPENDQSYMLCRLTPDEVNALLLPLAPYKKTEVRALAEELGLPVARKIRDVKEALEFSMTLEQRTVDSYNEWARLCAAEDDQITHKLFQDLAKEEEEHLDMFRTEMENMLNYGEQYLALQSIAHSKEITKK